MGHAASSPSFGSALAPSQTSWQHVLLNSPTVSQLVRHCEKFTTEARRTQRRLGERRFYVPLPLFTSASLWLFHFPFYNVICPIIADFLSQEKPFWGVFALGNWALLLPMSSCILGDSAKGVKERRKAKHRLRVLRSSFISSWHIYATLTGHS